MKTPRLTIVLALTAAALATGCSGRSPAGPTPAPTPASVGWTISGTVWTHGSAGVQAASGGEVFGWIQQDSRGETTGRVPIDASGRYRFPVPPGTSRVSIFGGPGEQVCAVTIVPTGDTVADVHTVVDTSLLGASLPSMLREMTPTLSGAVYENTLEGRQPVPNARVELDGLGGLGLPIAETRTDADGRYVLCAVPQIAGLYLYASAPGFDLFEQGHDLLGLTTLDIVLRRRN